MRLLISRPARMALRGDEALDGLSPGASRESRPTRAEGFRAARELAERLGPVVAPGGAAKVSAADLFAFARLEQALRAYLERYRQTRDADVFQRALAELDRRFGEEVVNRLLGSFEDEFLVDGRPSMIQDEPDGESARPQPDERRRERLLGELLVFSIAHSNPAAAALSHALHFGSLVADSQFDAVVAALNELLDRAPGLDEDDSSLIRGLRRPIEAAPDSIAEQLSWLQKHWSKLSAELESELTAALDFITEERMPRFPPGPGPGPGPGGGADPDAFPVLDPLDGTEVRYAADRSWMARMVLTAKNTHVWLHQLSVRHRREITRLDQIPDVELQTLAERGITGLWLIGLWERSRASQRIKQLCGNPEAAGSAYSLLAYRIADDLGGDEALENLAHRAGGFGIRLSADMVPNHTGIDSEWLIEEPDLFLSVPVCPFPSYTFEGPDLSSDPRVGIYLEDHYFDRSDAAVVFKRVDRETGDVRFVYHGNDGTGTAWNDTAQLDYLNPATRRRVTETILEVAGKFPIIRFDAAMTLARRHVQRLWHPVPGRVGAIPSRAEHAMSESAFDARMPNEFWRELVERAEAEAPDTLLLAEAFWLMETYFVRNLGVHRVYNSAFMHTLRDQDNRGYRQLVRKALDLDPEILRRYVNFLSNPDERTAIDQFGDGDRYFGACLLLATTPGLPMFAHGQIEGLSERYGMEYQRSYVDETPNEAMIERHERQIAPLLRERERFAGVEGFALHDFLSRRGTVDENVLAFSHGGAAPAGSLVGADVSLVIFNNQDAPARGVLRLDRDLGISGSTGRLCRFRDRLSGRYFLRAASALHDRGLELDLAPYESALLVNFREVASEDEVYLRLSRHLGLRGTASFEDTVRELDLDDARQAFADVMATLSVAAPLSAPAALAVEERLEELDLHLQRWLGDSRSPNPGAGLPGWLEAISRLAAVEQAAAWPRTQRMIGALERLLLGTERENNARFVLPAYALLGYLHRRWGADAVGALEPGSTAARVLAEAGIGAEDTDELGSLLQLAASDGWLESAPPPGRDESARLLESATESQSARLLGFDGNSGTLAREPLDRFLTWRATAAALSWLVVHSDLEDPDRGGTSDRRSRRAEAIVGWCDVLERLREVLDSAGFEVAPVLARLGRNDSEVEAE